MPFDNQKITFNGGLNDPAYEIIDNNITDDLIDYKTVISDASKNFYERGEDYQGYAVVIEVIPSERKLLLHLVPGNNNKSAQDGPITDKYGIPFEYYTYSEGAESRGDIHRNAVKTLHSHGLLNLANCRFSMGFYKIDFLNYTLELVEDDSSYINLKPNVFFITQKNTNELQYRGKINDKEIRGTILSNKIALNQKVLTNKLMQEKSKQILHEINEQVQLPEKNAIVRAINRSGSQNFLNDKYKNIRNFVKKLIP